MTDRDTGNSPVTEQRNESPGARAWRWLTETQTDPPPQWFSRPLWPHIVAACALVAVFVTIGVIRV